MDFEHAKQLVAEACAAAGKGRAFDGHCRDAQG